MERCHVHVPSNEQVRDRLDVPRPTAWGCDCFSVIEMEHVSIPKRFEICVAVCCNQFVVQKRFMEFIGRRCRMVRLETGMTEGDSQVLPDCAPDVSLMDIQNAQCLGEPKHVGVSNVGGKYGRTERVPEL